QQLEESGLIKREENGRVITPEGRSFLDKAAAEVKKEVEGLERY
ncbi:MAG TPA: 40S ribosomal protein S19, partial [Methanothermobacter thermautotrophicus]|nr:40S ribosomal protein S19 [Methanothermobacter thermautotrophicus]